MFNIDFDDFYEHVESSPEDFVNVVKENVVICATWDLEVCVENGKICPPKWWNLPSQMLMLWNGFALAHYGGMRGLAPQRGLGFRVLLAPYIPEPEVLTLCENGGCES